MAAQRSGGVVAKDGKKKGATGPPTTSSLIRALADAGRIGRIHIKKFSANPGNANASQVDALGGVSERQFINRRTRREMMEPYPKTIARLEPYASRKPASAFD